MWPFGKRTSRKSQALARLIRARFDAAVTNVENARHWANADGLSADAAASASVRRTLRNRSRYEVANNSYAKGVVLTLANDVVGTGPRLQVLSPDAEANRIVEQAFSQWASAVGLAEKLRTMRVAKAADGEAFALLTPQDWVAVGAVAGGGDWNLDHLERWDHETHIPGYFQFVCGSSPQRYPTNWKHAGGCDTVFTKGFPREKRYLLPGWDVVHLGVHGTNWHGRLTESWGRDVGETRYSTDEIRKRRQRYEIHRRRRGGFRARV